MLDPKVITRLNELYQKSKTVELTSEELEERNQLRSIYLSSIKAQVQETLEQIEVVTEDGTGENREHCCEDPNCKGHGHHHN